jgi:hypothetical protein
MCFKDLSVSRRTRFHDDFWVGTDTFFVNGFSVSSSLCALKMSASGVELGFLEEFLV